MAVKKECFFHDLLGHKIGSLHWEAVMEHIFTSVDVAAAASSNSVSVVETFTMLISQKQTLLSSDTSCAVEKRLCLAPQCTSSPFTSFIFCFSFSFVFLLCNPLLHLVFKTLMESQIDGPALTSLSCLCDGSFHWNKQTIFKTCIP